MRITKAVLSIAAALVATAATGESSYRYEVDWGPAKLAELSFSLSEAGGETRLSGVGRSRGLLEIFGKFEVAQSTTYRPDGTALFRAEGAFGGRNGAREVEWPEAGEPVVLLDEGDRDDGPRTPIPEGELLGTVDPFFPIVDTLRKLDEGSGCGGLYRVFTGQSRFNILIIDRGVEMLPADRDWTFGGDARRCQMHFTRIGGFPVKRSFWRVRESEVTRDLWIAPLGDRHVPVRLKVDWPLGYATGRIVLDD